MGKADRRDGLERGKGRVGQDPEAACGIFWPDASATTRYAIGEEDVITTLYGIGEEG